MAWRVVAASTEPSSEREWLRREKGESFLGCHDALVDMCHHLCRESGVSDADIGERGRGPEHLFQSVLPVYVRVQGQPPPPLHES